MPSKLIKRLVAGVLLILAVFFGTLAHARAQNAHDVIRGNYTDIGTGFKIDFPKGWSGSLVNRSNGNEGKVEGNNNTHNNLVVVSPVDLQQQPRQVRNVNGSDVSMSVVVVNRFEVKNLITSEFGAVNNNNSNKEKCQKVTTELVPINGITAFHVIIQCTERGQQSQQLLQQQEQDKNQHHQHHQPISITNRYIFFGLVKSVAVSYTASSQSSYDGYLSDFTSSVQTARLDEPVNLRSALEIVLGITKFYKEPIKISTATNATIASSNNNTLTTNTATNIIIIGTSSATINSVSIENNSRLVVKLDEQTRQSGRMLLPVEKIPFSGPYQVLVDDILVSDPLVIADSQTKEKLVLVEYGEGKHNVVISEQSISEIPEFPLNVMGVLAAASITVSILYHRKKEASHHHQKRR